MKKVRFIINPHSGVGKKGKLQRTIEACLKQRQVEYEICFTEGPGHATLLCEEAVKAGYEAVVTVGGDGSVNETARGLVHTDTALGIIPAGSGNGFARHCRIPLNKAKAIDAICNMNTALNDTGKLNDQLFVGTAGLGFDAHISRLFTGFGKRGFGS
ncbi:MAG: diacylglycerol/lipid kinase family protein, partial [Flavobacteriales bacterium]